MGQNKFGIIKPPNYLIVFDIRLFIHVPRHCTARFRDVV